MRGKKRGVACGDRVNVRVAAAGQGVIEEILPRTSLLYRSDQARQKLIAANVSQLVIVVAAIPTFSEELINRCIAAAEQQQLKVLLVCNKSDLVEPSRVALATLALYRELGYNVLQLSAKTDSSPLLSYLHGHLSILIGQSGMGKSTLLNALIPAAERATADISLALDSGRHTTTHARLYYLEKDTGLIDSPGMQAFGLHHLNCEELAWGFIEFRPYLGLCKFSNCRHGREPGCALAQAMREGKINLRRVAFYRKLALSGAGLGVREPVADS
jgi:ribosome biogenesis GTPase